MTYVMIAWHRLGGTVHCHEQGAAAGRQVSGESASQEQLQGLMISLEQLWNGRDRLRQGIPELLGLRQAWQLPFLT